MSDVFWGNAVVSFTKWAVFEGVLTAIVLCILGYLFSMKATHEVEAFFLNRDQQPGISGVYAGILVRMLFVVGGIIVVFCCFGRSWAVPCALGMMPLCFLEVMCSMVVQVRRNKTRRKIAKSESKS